MTRLEVLELLRELLTEAGGVIVVPDEEEATTYVDSFRLATAIGYRIEAERELARR